MSKTGSRAVTERAGSFFLKIGQNNVCSNIHLVMLHLERPSVELKYGLCTNKGACIFRRYTPPCYMLFPASDGFMYTHARRRSWPAIVVDILEVTLTPSNKMRIMYKSNLNFERFNKYFYDLLRRGFIEEMNNPKGRQVYRITERGRTLLEVLRKGLELFSSE